MKKLLIATAAMAMVAGTAQAQSSVTVYGVVDVNYNSTEKAGVTGTAQGQSNLKTSIFGFKGEEDLGGGLKAQFQLESRLDPNSGKLGTNTSTFTGTAATITGTGNVNNDNTTASYTPAGKVSTTNALFNREAWVGLSSAKLGSIRMGTTDTTSAQGIDSTVGQAGTLSDAADNLGTDQGKTVRYTTPEFAGLSAQVGYTNAGAAAGAETTAGRLTSVHVQYVAGKLGVYAGQTSNKIDGTYDQKETVYGAKYDFGFAAVGAYQSVKDAATNTGNDYKQTIFSVSAPVAALGSGVTAHGVYYKNEYDVANTDGDVDGYKLALSKAFSKRTIGYVAYIDQSDNVAGSIANNSKSYVVGVAHAF